MFEKNFVILTDARTGSNALARALHTHGDIYSDTEIFHSQRIYGHQLDCETLLERDQDPVAFLRRHRERAAAIKPDAHLYGFKLFLDHNDTVKDSLITNRDWKKLLLSRENTLDQFISLTIAQHSQTWISHKVDTKPTKVFIDPNAYLDFHQNRVTAFNKVRQELKQAGGKWLDLDYTDVAAQNFGPVLEFLGVEGPNRIELNIAKQNPSATADKVENTQDLYTALKAHNLDSFWVD